jgi:hypothetical protein
MEVLEILMIVTGACMGLIVMGFLKIAAGIEQPTSLYLISMVAFSGLFYGMFC